MKKFLKKISKTGLLATINIGGEHTVEFPLPARWSGAEDVLIEGADIVNILIVLGSIIAVGMMITSGYILITSAGNPDKIEQGQKSLTGAIIGLAVVWIAGLVIKTVLKVFAS